MIFNFNYIKINIYAMLPLISPSCLHGYTVIIQALIPTFVSHNRSQSFQIFSQTVQTRIACQIVLLIFSLIAIIASQIELESGIDCG